MDKLDYKAFESLFTPHERLYIESYVAAKVSEILEPAALKMTQAAAAFEKLTAEVETLKTQVAAYESNFKDDAKYALTRPKVIALLKKEGIY